MPAPAPGPGPDRVRASTKQVGASEFNPQVILSGDDDLNSVGHGCDLRWARYYIACVRRFRFLCVFVPVAIFALWNWWTNLDCAPVGPPVERLIAAVECAHPRSAAISAAALVFGWVLAALARDWRKSGPPGWAVDLCAFAFGAVASVGAVAGVFVVWVVGGLRVLWGVEWGDSSKLNSISTAANGLWLLWMLGFVALALFTLFGVYSPVAEWARKVFGYSSAATATLLVPATAVAVAVGVSVAAMIVAAIAAVLLFYAALYAMYAIFGMILVGMVVGAAKR